MSGSRLVQRLIVMRTIRTSATAQIKADTLHAAGSIRHNAARVAAKKSEQRVKALVRTRRVKADNVQDDGHMEVDSIDLKQAIDLWALGDLTREFLHDNISRFHFSMDGAGRVVEVVQKANEDRAFRSLQLAQLADRRSGARDAADINLEAERDAATASARVKVEHGAEAANHRDLDTLLNWFDTQNAAKVAKANFHIADCDSTNDDATCTVKPAPSSRVLASSSRNSADSVLESDPEDGDDVHIQQVAEDKAQDARIREWRDATAALGP
ncbi:hypothetical protein GGX14DRAFT_573091 [Mycena pura]|uniref:Uncharacterized protein n=1 Tax=Mycena pura TaxID=153505 RepID=A0AAD6V3U1_9AGAR|nr:hypothetical protein GGX14DRAFT_573091 [Mycena pura]